MNNKKEKRLESLYQALREEVGSSIMDIVDEIVELELLLEKESNK